MKKEPNKGYLSIKYAEGVRFYGLTLHVFCIFLIFIVLYFFQGILARNNTE